MSITRCSVPVACCLLLLLMLLLEPADGHRTRAQRARQRARQRRRQQLELGTQLACEPEIQPQLGRGLEVRNNYYLAFRGKAGIGQSVYQAFVSGGQDDDRLQQGLLNCGCLSVNGQRPCQGHYRSRILSLWNSLGIDRVRVSIYLRGVEQVFFEFNGRGTTPVTFFAPDRLIRSSFSDTGTSKSLYNFFSVQGHERLPKVQRRFFVNRKYAGNCQEDEGWMVAVDSADDCAFTQKYTVPAFLFSSGSTAQVWNSGNILNGDLLVVTVKFTNNFVPNFVTNFNPC